MTTDFNQFCENIIKEALKDWVTAGAVSTAMMYPAYKKALNYSPPEKNKIEHVASTNNTVPKAIPIGQAKKIAPTTPEQIVEKMKSLRGNKILLKSYVSKLKPDDIRGLTGLSKDVPDNMLAPILFAGVYTDFVRFDIVAAILARESVFGKGLDKHGKGDHGHGHGVMQIDDRSHAKWLALGLWNDPYENIIYGINEIKMNLRMFKGDLFKAVAAYNTGAGNVRRSLKNQRSAEATTAHGNYATDVINRAKKYREKTNLFVATSNL